MILERNKRYFKRYRLRMKARAKYAPALPLFAPDAKHSILRAIRMAMRVGKAKSDQPNGDTIELVKAEHDSRRKIVVLLFHRASPDAADPAYRKRVKNKVKLRLTKKESDEEQAVSSHLLIWTEPVEPGAYNAVLEEVPGLSLSAVSRILGTLLNNYKFGYEEGGEEKETYTTFRAEGIKSETLTNALKKKGALTYLTLTRTAPVDAPDAEGLAEPQTERVKYKVKGNPASRAWRERLKEFVTGAKSDWDQVSVDIRLDDNRSRTVRIDQESEAAELLFVRSELAYLGKDVDTCSLNPVPEIVNAGLKILKKPSV